MVAAFAAVCSFVRNRRRSSESGSLRSATGMLGQGVLRECLLDPDVESVLAIVRKTSLPQHVKLREIVHQDVSDLSAIEDRLAGFDACFFCLWVSSMGMKEKEYRRLKFDLTVAGAATLCNVNPPL